MLSKVQKEDDGEEQSEVLRKETVMLGCYKCPYCGEYLDTAAYNVSSSSSRKGTTRSMVYFHDKCYQKEMEKRRAAREKRLQKERDDVPCRM